MRPDHRRGRPPSWGLALLVLAYLVGTFGDALHWLTTAHRLCEIHGRIEHVTAGVAEEDHAPGSARSGPVVRADASSHEGCALGGLATERSVPLTLDAAESMPLRPATAHPPAPPGRVPDGPRHALAPSRSPPEA